MNSELAEDLMNEAEEIESEEEEVRQKDSIYGFPMREVDLRRNPNGRVVDIKQLWSRHKEIIQLDSMGMYTQEEIARMLNVTPTTVSNCLNSTLGKEAKLALREIRDAEYEAMVDDVIELTKKGLKIYDEILSDEAENRKLKKETADTVVLDLAGMRAPTKIQSMTAHAILTSDEIAAFKERGIKAAIDSGKLIDIEGE